MLSDRSVCVPVCVRDFRRALPIFGKIAERILCDERSDRVPAPRDMVAKALEILATSGRKQGRHVLMTAQDISIIVQILESENVS